MSHLFALAMKYSCTINKSELKLLKFKKTLEDCLYKSNQAIFKTSRVAKFINPKEWILIIISLPKEGV